MSNIIDHDSLAAALAKRGWRVVHADFAKPYFRVAKRYSGEQQDVDRFAPTIEKLIQRCDATDASGANT